jgi:DUF1680 family protein
MYSLAPNRLYIHLYNPNSTQFNIHGQDVQLEETTNYPWDGRIQFTLQLANPVSFDLALRIPGWCRKYQIEVNGEPQQPKLDKGYVILSRMWTSGDTVTLALDMPVERMMPHPMIRQDAGHVALQRGPIVYCLEQADNGENLANVILPPDSTLTASVDKDLFGGVVTITGQAARAEIPNWAGNLYQPQSQLHPTHTHFTLKAIPYFLWANREPGEMCVWIRES